MAAHATAHHLEPRQGERDTSGRPPSKSRRGQGRKYRYESQRLGAIYINCVFVMGNNLHDSVLRNPKAGRGCAPCDGASPAARALWACDPYRSAKTRVNSAPRKKT